MTEEKGEKKYPLMKYERAGFVKYKNRLLPRYKKEHWTIWLSETKGTCFNNWEKAKIYYELIKIKKDMIIRKQEKE